MYEVLGIECGHYRILSDSDEPHAANEPFLYEPEIFRVVDAAEPDFWVTEFVDGQQYSYPAVWFKGCFFEDYHDRVQEVRERFRLDLQRLYPTTWNACAGTANTSLERTRDR
jgi:hypothetical protein